MDILITANLKNGTSFQLLGIWGCSLIGVIYYRDYDGFFKFPVFYGCPVQGSTSLWDTECPQSDTDALQ